MTEQEAAGSSTKKKLIDIFKKHVSYDCSGYIPEKKCPHCHVVIEKEAYFNYWLDHRSVLSDNLFSALDIPERFRSSFDDWMGEQYVTGDENKDAEKFAELIMAEWVK